MNVADLQLSTSSKRDSKDVSKSLKIAFLSKKKGGDCLTFWNMAISRNVTQIGTSGLAVKYLFYEKLHSSFLNRTLY